jgi:hypothetical protein
MADESQGQRAHTSIPFQCEQCWFQNLEGRSPVPGLDDVYTKFIHQANLDAMNGHTATTIEAHAAAVKQTIGNSK